ncbi:MAG: PA14 domain-containing protein [Flavobacteriales bacterium]|jgi:hypothetical protein|tara:strand:+ start:9254 stop:10786 length:1533 start_codon:yes stop_codon:yes gene_type:complete
MNCLINKLKKILLPLIVVFVSLVSIKNYSQDKNGLVGILYDDVKLTRIKSIWYLNALNSSETDWSKKKDFSAKWIGYLKAPITGEITIYGEADNEMQLTIEGNTVVNTWGDVHKPQGKIYVEKGKLYETTLLYRQINGNSYMRAFWSWNGHEKKNIPASNLSFDKNNDTEILKEFTSQVNVVDLSQLEFNVDSIIDIHSENDVLEKRTAVIDFLWGDTGLPKNKLPNEVSKGITDVDFGTLNNLQRMDRLTIDMDFGLNSIAYHFIPKKSNGQLTIYHQGHDGKFSIGIRTINAFLEKGYDVIALSMPVKGMNSRPIVHLKRFGKVMVENHELFRFLTPEKGIPVKYFLEPVTVVLNYAEKFNFKRTIMIGLSGGGWTTTQYAAIDTRIEISFPVAGSLPVYVRMRELDNLSTFYGDYEQSIPELLDIANYLELYIMASHGKDRSQFQILNEFDNCCFRGTGANSYKKIVKNCVESLGEGSYDLFIDATHTKHQISPKALEIIFKHLQKN